MIKASATVAIMYYRDTNSITRYYKLQSSTASVPSKPTTNPPPSGWNDSEPSYTSESTNTLYFCDLSVFSDGTFSYSAVNLEYFVTKYLYIHDTKIIGHNNNSLTSTSSSEITYTNNRFVLRYVIEI